ncbi:MAG: hypothetical protein AAGN35_01625 [Bacteroidota bacterium]
MQIETRTIAKIDLRHAYFQAGVWRGVEVTASPATQARLVRHRLRLHTEGHQILVVRDFPIFPGGRSAPEPQPETVPLRLDLRPIDPWYPQFTELPEWDLLRKCLYFSDRDRAGNLRNHRLSEAEVAGAGDIYPLHSAIFSVQVGAPDCKVMAYAADGSELVAYSGGDGRAALDLRAHPEGRFRIALPEGKSEYVVTAQEARKRVFARIDLQLDTRSQVYRGQAITQYVLDFAAREVYWNYNIEVGERNFSTLRIIDPDQQMEFVPVESDRVPAARTFRFRTTRKVRLAEFYPYAFRLVNGTNSAVISERLPFPSLKYLKRHPDQADALVAESYLVLEQK